MLGSHSGSLTHGHQWGRPLPTLCSRGGQCLRSPSCRRPSGLWDAWLTLRSAPPPCDLGAGLSHFTHLNTGSALSSSFKGESGRFSGSRTVWREAYVPPAACSTPKDTRGLSQPKPPERVFWPQFNLAGATIWTHPALHSRDLTHWSARNSLQEQREPGRRERAGAARGLP